MTMPDPRIGLDFGDYKVTRKIAEGGMGAVYLAEHSSGMRKVVKFMLGEALRIPAIRKRFENECLAAKRLNEALRRDFGRDEHPVRLRRRTSFEGSLGHNANSTV